MKTYDPSDYPIGTCLLLNGKEYYKAVIPNINAGRGSHVWALYGDDARGWCTNTDSEGIVCAPFSCLEGGGIRIVYPWEVL
jgi:hypothetical protein